MNKKKETSTVEQERIKLAQKLADWVNENPSERACICILRSGNTSSIALVGNHRLTVEAIASAIDTEKSKVREIVVESMILAAMARVSEE